MHHTSPVKNFSGLLCFLINIECFVETDDMWISTLHSCPFQMLIVEYYFDALINISSVVWMNGINCPVLIDWWELPAFGSFDVLDLYGSFGHGSHWVWQLWCMLSVGCVVYLCLFLDLFTYESDMTTLSRQRDLLVRTVKTGWQNDTYCRFGDKSDTFVLKWRQRCRVNSHIRIFLATAK